MRISFIGMSAVSMTRRGSSVSVCFRSPRFSEMSDIMSPMFSFGHITKAFTMGSRISLMKVASGMNAGLSTVFSVPSVSLTWYTTLG